MVKVSTRFVVIVVTESFKHDWKSIENENVFEKKNYCGNDGFCH